MCTLPTGSVTFRLKDHLATRESARQEAKNCLRRYEVSTALQSGYQVSFECCDSEIIDRNPPLPGEPQVIKSYFWSAEIILLEDALPTPVLEHPCTPIREMVGPRPSPKRSEAPRACISYACIGPSAW